MGKTSAKVTNRYKKKKYDILNATIPKGYIAKMREVCTAEGKSVNSGMIEKIVQKIGVNPSEEEEA